MPWQKFQYLKTYIKIWNWTEGYGWLASNRNSAFYMNIYDCKIFRKMEPIFEKFFFVCSVVTSYNKKSFEFVLVASSPLPDICNNCNFYRVTLRTYLECSITTFEFGGRKFFQSFLWPQQINSVSRIQNWVLLFEESRVYLFNRFPFPILMITSSLYYLK